MIQTIEETSVQTILIKPDALDGNIIVIFRNKPKPKLLLEKVDAESGIRLPGATFCVSRRGSAEYVDVTTGSDGIVLLENLEEDWYEVLELRSQTGYTLDDTHHDIELIAGKTATLTMLFNILSYISHTLISGGNTAGVFEGLHVFLFNPVAVFYIRNAMKRVRKRNSMIILASQEYRGLPAPRRRGDDKTAVLHPGTIDKRAYILKPKEGSPARFVDLFPSRG